MAENLILDTGTGKVHGAKFLASPNQDERPPGMDVDVLVIHAISLPPDTFDGEYVEAFFTNCLDCSIHPYFREIEDLKVSAHFYIRRSGEIIQFVPTNRRAWHAGDSDFHGRSRVNDFSIGIELEGCDDLPFEDSQYESLVRLTQTLFEGYSRLNPNQIVGHCDVSPGRKTDPGPCFDWNRYLDALE